MLSWFDREKERAWAHVGVNEELGDNSETSESSWWEEEEAGESSRETEAGSRWQCCVLFNKTQNGHCPSFNSINRLPLHIVYRHTPMPDYFSWRITLESVSF